ncbi:MAG: hypothetical protein ABJG41_08720 [Cyclobacteriaceae bacterium]
MKKSGLSIFVLLGSVIIATAQDADSLKTTQSKPVVVEQADTTSVIKEETVAQPAATPMVSDSLPALPPVEEPVSTTPRIIYYQDSKPDYKDKRNDVKTLSGSMNHSGGFFGASFRASEFNSETAVLAGFRTGWIVNRTVGIGVEGHGIIPTAKFDGIDPDRSTVLLGGYGGMFMEFILFSNQVVHITFPIAGGAGWLGYHIDWEEDRINDPNFNTTNGIVDQDVFWYVEPGASLEMNVSRSFRIAFGVSKRFTQDFELINTSSSDFENLNFFMTLKLGKF